MKCHLRLIRLYPLPEGTLRVFANVEMRVVGCYLLQGGLCRGFVPQFIGQQRHEIATGLESR